MQNCKSSNTPVIKGDKFSLDQCLKNAFEEKNVKNFLCVNRREFDLCLSLYAFGYYVYYWDVG